MLHEEARALLDRLEAGYTVARAEGGPSLDPDLADQVVVDAVVRLTPERGGGAPLTVAFTRFPGLAVRFGRWTVSFLPVCGCDACDEEPRDLLDEMESRVDVTVSGGFRECLGGGPSPSLEHWFGETRAGWSALDPADAAALGPPADVTWPAWPRRVIR